MMMTPEALFSLASSAVLPAWLGLPHLLVVPCLLLTFLFGPIGLLLHFVLRGLLRKRAVQVRRLDRDLPVLGGLAARVRPTRRESRGRLGQPGGIARDAGRDRLHRGPGAARACARCSWRAPLEGA
jgi:hypothetical protein